MAPQRKCYYEVLGIERNADDDEIKKSFKKLALQHHPDKNPTRMEEAKKEFQVIQEAYQVLSNYQDRAWYDEHRHLVLNGGFDNYEDNAIDLMPFCTSSAYKGFGDEENSFYSVYRTLFEKLESEEREALDNLEDEDEEMDPVEIPSFGSSESSYEEVVRPFYHFWESFSTKKNFSWVDEFDRRQAESRRIARLMDKENKKVRSDAKKDWNQKVRALVDFVKKRDKRIQQWKKEQEIIEKEKEIALAKKTEEEKKKRMEERKKLRESFKDVQAPESKNMIKELESWVATEFGEENANESDSEEELELLHCAACNKSFRSEKAFLNHEKSKKHLTRVQQLKEILDEEEKLFVSQESEPVLVSPEVTMSVCGILTEEKDLKDDELLTNYDVINMMTESFEITNLETSDEPISEEDVEQFELLNVNEKGEVKVIDSDSDWNTKKKSEKKKKRGGKAEKKMDEKVDKLNPIPVPVPEPVEQPGELKNIPTVQRTTKQKASCRTCNTNFESKSKLFAHLKESGHQTIVGAPPDELLAKESEMQAKNKKGKKGKRR